MMMYCVKCRTKREAKDPQNTTMKNGKKAVRATCSVCGSGMYQIGASV